MSLEESRKRTEASLARKRINAGLANNVSSGSEAPQSPVTSGAMDSLLEKLRAAAPQARDQRDRRRRARLKERHQVRVASGQKIPEISGSDGVDTENNNGSESHGNLASNSNDTDSTETGLLSPPIQESDSGSVKDSSQVSESEDVADRAASMLQGLRDNADGERTRQRRETAEEERRKRRLRRRNGATNGSKDSTDGSALSSVPESASPPQTDSMETGESAASCSPPAEEDATPKPPLTPSIVVSPTVDQHPGSPGDDAEDDSFNRALRKPIEQSD
ncbi:hypothetical protein EYZ11_003120 [Aspergillus tanneri]|nr:hypothetical protein EYZ11_003120 [Aspergillus tanneri]